MLNELLELYLEHTFDVPVGLIKSDLRELSKYLTPEELKTVVKQAYFFRTQEIDNSALRASVCDFAGLLACDSYIEDGLLVLSPDFWYVADLTNSYCKAILELGYVTPSSNLLVPIEKSKWLKFRDGIRIPIFETVGGYIIPGEEEGVQFCDTAERWFYREAPGALEVLRGAFTGKGTSLEEVISDFIKQFVYEV